MKTVLLALLAFTGLVCTTDHGASDEPAAIVIDLPPSHDALYHGIDDESFCIEWSGHSQYLIPFPLELIHYDSGLFDLTADLLDASDSMDYLGTMILGNLQQMRSLPPAILRMETKAMHSLISSQ